MSILQGERRILVQIRSRIIDSGRDTRYDLEAYGFLLASLDYYRSKTDKVGHIPASTVVESYLELAAMKYGPMAFALLKDWGVETSLDIGTIVYNLIDIELLSSDKEESLDDFVDLPPFKEVVNPQESYIIDKESIKKFIDS